MRIIGFLTAVLIYISPCAATPEPAEIVRQAIDNWRDKTSQISGSMTIHRPEWTRTMHFDSWTMGSDKSLVRFTAPPKDAGNASLTVGSTSWSFAPKVNKTIQIPASMTAQPWMGSDISYRDLSRSSEIVTNYTHRLLSETALDDKMVYTIESIPKEDSAVVWGKEILKIREDNLILNHTFYDQDLIAIKELVILEHKIVSNKAFPTKMRMQQLTADEADNWTEVIYDKIALNLPLNPQQFSPTALANLN